jgi:hypothetical protein
VFARLGGGGGWLSGLSDAAPEVLPDAESRSADRGVPGGSKEVSMRRNMGEEGVKGGEEGEAEGDGN